MSGAAPGETEIRNDVGSALRVSGTVNVADAGDAVSVDDNGGSLTVDGTVGLDPASNTVRDGSQTAPLVEQLFVLSYESDASTNVLDVAGFRTVRVFVHRDEDSSSDCSAFDVSVWGGGGGGEMLLEHVPGVIATETDWTATYDVPGTTLSIKMHNGLGGARVGTCGAFVAAYGRSN